MRDGGTHHEGDGDAHDFRNSQAHWELLSTCVQARRDCCSEPADNKGPNNDEEPQRPFADVVTLPAEDHEGAKAYAVQDRRPYDFYRRPRACAIQLGSRLTTMAAMSSSR